MEDGDTVAQGEGLALCNKQLGCKADSDVRLLGGNRQLAFRLQLQLIKTTRVRQCTMVVIKLGKSADHTEVVRLDPF